MSALVFEDNKYYGPYNKLLYTLFPADSDLIVSPNSAPRAHPRGQASPTLVAQFDAGGSRQANSPPFGRFVSAMGTKLCFYEFERAPRRMTPRRIPSDPEFIIDVAPQEQWDCDVLEADGEQRLRALATQITEACVHLQA